MNNPFKNNSLASGLLGFILGVFALLGGQSIMESIGNSHDIPSYFFAGGDAKVNPSRYNIPPFHGLPNNPDGDVVITKTGKCFHSRYGCSSLNRSKNIRTVNRIDAENAGISACTKCDP